MADQIVSGHQTTVDKLRNHGLVTVRVDLLLRVEKTEAYTVIATQVLPRVSDNEFYEMFDAGKFESFSSNARLFRENFESNDPVTFRAACEGQPQRGVTTRLFQSRREDRSGPLRKEGL